MRSVGRVLRHRGDLLLGLWPVRAVLALLLVMSQSFDVSGAAPGGLPAALATLSVTGLFALGGFSAARPSTGATWREAMMRRLRLALPPFAFIVLASVVLLGPLITNRGLENYAADPATYAYLLNLVGVPRYDLPGVFEFNDVADVVNAMVWMAPLYLIVIAVAALRSPRRWVRAVPGGLAAALALGSLLTEALDLLPGSSRDLTVTALRGDGAAALLGGLLGAAAFQARARVPADWRLAIASAILIGTYIAMGGGLGQAASLVRVGVTVPFAYLAIFLALRPLPYAPIGRALAPYLPGLVLFSFPLQQLAIQLGPRPQSPLVNVALAGSAALALSALFWHLIGRRIVRRPIAPHTIQAAPARQVRRWLWTVRRAEKQAIVGYLLACLLIMVTFLALLWMVYLAMQPDSGGR